MGRKAKITAEKYIDAVIKTRGFNDQQIGDIIRVSRIAVYNYRTNPKNEQVIKDAQIKLDEITNVRFDNIHTSKQQYLELPIIAKWTQLMEGRELKFRTIDSRLSAIYNVCKHLEVHPDNLSLEMCGELIREIKKMDKAPHGLSYSYIRKPIRSFFELLHGISGELLTTMGIKADRINLGAYASEFVTRDQRTIFQDSLYGFVCKATKPDEDRTMITKEILGLVHFMFNTGSRITASLNMDCRDRKHKLNNPDLIELHIYDKGDQHWNKKLIGYGIEQMKEYVKSNLGIEDMTQLTSLEGKVFPWCNERPRNMRIERLVVRQALEYAGVIDLMQPNHIWRHTFAQEALRASNWNYEIVAELGGWGTSEELKKSYGKIGQDVLERGLRQMLGLEVVQDKYILRW